MESQVCISKADNLDIILKTKINNVYTNYNLTDFYKYLEQFTEKDWDVMTVSNRGNNIIDNTKRSSKLLNKFIYYFKCYNFEDKFYINEYTAYIIDKKYLSFANKSFKNGICNLKLIKYEVGDHFDEFHYDTMKTHGTNSMIGTILLFPPVDLKNNFEGGDLIFKDGDNEMIVEPSKFTNWTMVTFGEVLHKCTPVTSGVRYVIKGEIWSAFPNIYIPTQGLDLPILEEIIKKNPKKNFDEEKNNILTTMKTNIITCLDNIKNTMLTEVDKVSKKGFEKKYYFDKTDYTKTNYCKDFIDLLVEFNEMQNIYNKFLEHKNTEISSYLEYVIENKLNFNNEKNVLVLNKFYELPYDINKFTIEHIDIIKYLKEKEFNITLFNRKTSKFIDTISTEYNNDFNYIYENEIKIGELIEKKSEYNDEGGYDDTYLYNSTCLYYWK